MDDRVTLTEHDRHSPNCCESVLAKKSCHCSFVSHLRTNLQYRSVEERRRILEDSLYWGVVGFPATSIRRFAALRNENGWNIRARRNALAHFDEHCSDCERLLGDRCEDVNRWIDNAFADFGPRHRFVKHHWTGVERASQLFGDRGRKAAIIHILKDCGHIPTESQWISKSTDFFGMNPDPRFNGYWDPKQFDEAAHKLLKGPARRISR